MNDLGDTDLAKHAVEIILTVLCKEFKMVVFPSQLIKENLGDYVKCQNMSNEEVENASI